MKIESNPINKKSRLLILFGITVLMIYIAFFVYKVPFSTNDDWVLMRQIGWEHNYKILFIGATITYPMVMLSKVTGLFNIFGISMVLSLTVCALIWQYLLWKEKCTNTAHILLFLIKCLLMLNFTYTTIAFSMIATGLMWGYVIDKCEETSVWRFVCCVLLVFFGVSWRPDGIFIIVLFIPILIERFFHSNKGIFLLLMLWALMAYIIITQINKAIFNSSELSEYHIKYNSIRTFFIDRPKFDYVKYKDVFTNAGWTENIYNAFYGGFIYDNNYFGYDKLNEIRSQLSFFDAYQINPVKLVKTIIVNTIKIGSISVYFVAATGIFIIKIKNNKKHSAGSYFLASYLMPYALFLMLIIRQRFIERVSMVFVCFGLLMLLICKYDVSEYGFFGKILYNRLIHPVKETKSRLAACKIPQIAVQVLKLCPIFVLIVFIASYVVRYCTIRTNTNNYEAAKELTEYMNNHIENLYVMCPGSEYKDYFNAMPALYFTEDVFAENLIFTKGTQTFSETYYEIMSKYDLVDKENIFKSMVLNDNVYFVASQGDKEVLYRLFMKDAYDMDVELTQIEYFDNGDAVYSVTTTPV